MNIRLSTVFALVFSGMGTIFLFVLVVLERSAFPIIFDIQNGDDASVIAVYSALRMVIDVLPYALGPFIAGTVFSGIWAVVKSPKSVLAWSALIVMCLVMFYNIFMADTAGVVATMKATTSDQTIQDFRFATQGVMRQHHLGILGFGYFFLAHWATLLKWPRNSVNRMTSAMAKI